MSWTWFYLPCCRCKNLVSCYHILRIRGPTGVLVVVPSTLSCLQVLILRSSCINYSVYRWAVLPYINAIDIMRDSWDGQAASVNSLVGWNPPSCICFWGSCESGQLLFMNFSRVPKEFWNWLLDYRVSNMLLQFLHTMEAMSRCTWH